MAPIIDVNEKDFERAKQILTLSGVKYSPIEKERIADLQADAPKGFIYVPTIKMYVSRERVGFNENFENQQRIAREEGGRMITIPEFKEVLKRCLDSLPEKWNTCVKLKYLTQKSGEEICQELKITPSNFWQIVHRAKLQLRDCIENNWFKN